MRSFSRHNLIQAELQFLTHKDQNWLDRLFYRFYRKTKVEYNISVPSSIYLRAESFCDDITEISEVIFTQRDLLTLLYDDFLLFVRKTDNIEIIYTQLMMKYQSYTTRFPIKVNKETINNRFPSYLIQSEYLEHNNIIELEILFARRKALRGEIVLSDMDEQFPGHPFTLERILEMLLCDFIEEYKKGNHKEVIMKIVDNISKD